MVLYLSKPGTTLYRILDQGRWAPSGDNVQPWRFHIIDSKTVEVSYSTSDLNVYEYRNGEPIHISVGALCETLRIAASKEKWGCTWRYIGQKNGLQHVRVYFFEDNKMTENPLSAFIQTRSVNRHAYQKSQLSPLHKEALQASLGEKLSLEWKESKKDKHTISRLNAMATDIRLRIQEAYKVHQEIIEWDNPFSTDKIPIHTLPVSKPSQQVMRWSLKKWSRANFLNRYLKGTLLPQLEMDLVPGTHCAAHYFISSAYPIEGNPAALLEIGASVQRFWLTATSLGMAMQPSLATLIFADYGHKDKYFTYDMEIFNKAKRLANRLAELRARFNKPDNTLVFSGRVGYPLALKSPSRSLRLPLEKLILPQEDQP